STSTTSSATSTSTTGSTSTSTGQTSGALPDGDDQLVATETFSFDVADATSNLIALSAATKW
ncbi:MAG: flagellar hook-associated 2-like protein, partial [Oscillatoriales cyanobacterium]